MAAGSIYLASDLHLGAPDAATSRARELRFVHWLERIREDALEIYLLGDLFDFWFEYRRAVPKGYVRLLGKLAELRDAGIPIYVFTGNHDLWYRDYFPQELGIEVFYGPITRTFFNRKYYLAHGDGLGPGDAGYKFIKRLFTNRCLQWVFEKIHPNQGIALADYLSSRSRSKTRQHDTKDYGENEHLYQYVQTFQQQDDSYDCFIFGHRHLCKRVAMGKAELVFLGEWISLSSYAKITSMGLQLFCEA